jgi:hypothetical protein
MDRNYTQVCSDRRGMVVGCMYIARHRIRFGWVSKRAAPGTQRRIKKSWKNLLFLRKEMVWWSHKVYNRRSTKGIVIFTTWKTSSQNARKYSKSKSSPHRHSRCIQQATAESKSDLSNINAAVRNVTAEHKKHATKQQLNKLAPFCVERWGNRWCRLWNGARGTVGKGEVACRLMHSQGVTNEFLWWPSHAPEGLWNTSSDIIRSSSLSYI